MPSLVKLARELAALDTESYKQVLAFTRELGGRKPVRKVRRRKRKASAPLAKRTRAPKPAPKPQSVEVKGD